MEKRLFNSKYSKYVIIFVLALIVGTIFANLSGSERISGCGILDSDTVKSYTQSKVSFAGQFGYVAGRRAAAMVIVILAAMTPFRKTFAGVICTYLGVATGIIIASLTIQYGIRYFIIFPTAVLLHTFFYGYGIYGMFSREIIKNPSEILRVLRTVTAWGIGVFMETIVTYYILPKVLLLW